MEGSVLLGNRVQLIFFNPKFYTPVHSFEAKPSKNSRCAVAASAVEAAPSAGSSVKSRSVSYEARRSAMLDIQKCDDFHSAISRSGNILRVEDLNFVMRQLGKLNRLVDLSQLFDWMRRNGKVNFASYSSYMKLMDKSLDPLKALEIYKSIKDESTRTSVSVCNSVLRCLIRRGKFEISIKLFHQMKGDGLPPDVVTYSTLLSGCAKAKDGYLKALELVRELEHDGLGMDSVIYGTLISVCASNNQFKEAESYFNQMKSEGHFPNIFHYGSLLNAYSNDGNCKKADEILEEMKIAGLVPNKVILTTVLKVYVRGGLFEKARELLSELEACGYAEEEMPYCLLMDGLAKTGQINEAKMVFDETRKKHIKTDGYSYSIMISAFCRFGLLEEAKQLASDFEAKYEKYDVVILNTILCAYCRAGEMENVMKTMQKLDKMAINPDCDTYRILIKYFRKEKLYLLAYKTLMDMHKKGHQPEEEFCSSLIFHLGKTGAHAEAFSVYNTLRYSKRTMCKALHEKILNILADGRLLKDAYVVVKDNTEFISRPAIRKFANSFVRSGNINLLNDMIKTIHRSGYEIDKGIFSIAISRYISQPEKKELLLHLIDWMASQGYKIDPSARNLMLKNSHLFGWQRTAEILSKLHMVPKPRSLVN